MSHAHRHPVLAGGALALLAAVAFGLTTPFVQRFGEGIGPFSTGALLYAGAALATLGRARRIGRAHLGRVALVAACGAVIAPACLAWGLQRTSAVTASLLLNAEAAFTAVLARAAFAEPIGRRVAAAIALMTFGGVALVLGRGEGGAIVASAGALAVLAAALAWAADNTLTRPLAELDPAAVVRAKGALGAALSALVALALREPLPRAGAAAALVVCGALGYGASLRLYLLAQRRIGAARTASVFAAAPFVGAVAAWAMGRGDLGAAALVAAALFALGAWLHLSERHAHAHAHEAVEHEHPHRHDDGHHDHHHDVYPPGEHTHPHRHEATTHAHPHAPDIHHRHSH